jgi:Beta protein
MSAHNHYVPILKTKAGECWAVGNLSPTVSQLLTPLFEIHPHKDKDSVSHAEGMCETISSVWGTSSEFFLDTVWLHPGNGDPSLIATAFEYARGEGLQAIPVVRATYDQAALDVITDINAEDERGYVLRLPSDLAASHEAIHAVTRYLDIPLEKVDLLLDYRHHPMDLVADVPKLPNLGEWRRFIAASAAFPRSTASLPLNTWHHLPRHDWATWQKVGKVKRRPMFSDYVIRDPGPPATGGEPSANLKYTRAESWYVRIGRKLKQGYASDMYEICKSLVESGQFDGPTYSRGDAIINDLAEGRGAPGPGGAQQWLQWAMNHHLTFAAQQVQNSS